jgi:hypothetical protein
VTKHEEWIREGGWEHIEGEEQGARRSLNASLVKKLAS